MINLDDLIVLSTIISEKRFVAEVFVHYRAPATGYVGSKFFSGNIELNISGITYSYEVPEEDRDDCDLHCVWCNIVDKLLENRIAKKIVPKEDRMNKYYDSIYFRIKGTEIINKFKLVSLPDYSKIDLNNEVHRRYIIKQFMDTDGFRYQFEDSVKQKMDEILQEYSMGFLAGFDAYNQMLDIFKKSLDDYSVEKNIERIVDSNKN